jgi:hypothetical protein
MRDRGREATPVLRFIVGGVLRPAIRAAVSGPREAAYALSEIQVLLPH